MAPLNLVSDGDGFFRCATLRQIVASFIIRRERHDLNAVRTQIIFLLDDRLLTDMLEIFRLDCRATGLFAFDAGIKVKKGSTCRLKRNVNNPHGK